MESTGIVVTQQFGFPLCNLSTAYYSRRRCDLLKHHSPKRHSQTAATLWPQTNCSHSGAQTKATVGPKPKPLWGPNQSHQNKSNVLVLLCWPWGARRARSISHDGSSHSINHVDPGWKKVFWLVRWIINRWQSGGQFGASSPVLVFCLFVCVYTPVLGTVFELQTWNFKPRPSSRKQENGFLDFWKKSFLESPKTFSAQKWSKMEGFQLVKAPEVTLFSPKPWNLESILHWPKPKNGILDFWKK